MKAAVGCEKACKVGDKQGMIAEEIEREPSRPRGTSL